MTFWIIMACLFIVGGIAWIAWKESQPEEELFEKTRQVKDLEVGQHFKVDGRIYRRTPTGAVNIDDGDDLLDLLFVFLALDIISDGELDLNFTPEPDLSHEQSHGVLDVSPEASTPMAEAPEPAPEPSYESSRYDYSSGGDSNYGSSSSSYDTGGGYDSGGGDCGGGGCD